MNSRIRELATKAGMVEVEYHPGFPDIRYPKNFEKFAQLIVQECIEQLVKEGEAWEEFSRSPPQGQESNAGPALFAAYRLKEDAVSRLEEHFGVNQ
jgi:hypothetical protein